jgi:hypothetical protein
MKVEYYDKPVPFYIVRDYVEPDEGAFYLNELEDERVHMKREGTDSATDFSGAPKKANYGAWYNETTKLYKAGERLFGPVAWEMRNHWFYKLMPRLNKYATLASLYDNGDYYLPHTDRCIVTAILYLWREPKTFCGGDLHFGEFKVPIQNNSMVIFPSATEHSVTPIEGHGRWAVSYFLHESIEPPVKQVRNVLTVGAFKKVRFAIQEHKWQFLGSHWHIDLNNEPLFTSELPSLLGIDGHLAEVHARGQLYGQDIETITSGVTFVLHINEIEDEILPLWGGKTHEFVPVTNSGVVIKGDTRYRSMGPSRQSHELKMTIIWTFSS